MGLMNASILQEQKSREEKHEWREEWHRLRLEELEEDRKRRVEDCADALEIRNEDAKLYVNFMETLLLVLAKK